MDDFVEVKNKTELSHDNSFKIKIKMSSDHVYEQFPCVETLKCATEAFRLKERQKRDQEKLRKISDDILQVMVDGGNSIIIDLENLPSELDLFETTLNSKGYRVILKRRSEDDKLLEVIVAWD